MYLHMQSSAGSNLNFNSISFNCGLNSNMRVKFKGGLNCQIPTAIRVKTKCGLTSRAGKMHVITVYFMDTRKTKNIFSVLNLAFFLVSTCIPAIPCEQNVATETSFFRVLFSHWNPINVYKMLKLLEDEAQVNWHLDFWKDQFLKWRPKFCVTSATFQIFGKVKRISTKSARHLVA